MILSNVNVEGADLAINVGDENDANVRGMRITNCNISNPSAQPGTSASDAIAIVNSYNILVDHCRVTNANDDGIDSKSYDFAVVNCYVEKSGGNAVKFWRNAELINSILYDVTEIDDGAIIAERGPCRIVNSVLLNHSTGYAGTFNYDLLTTDNNLFEIVNSAFGECKAFYVNTTDVQAKNNRFFDILDESSLFEGVVNAQNADQLNAQPNCSGNALSTNQFVAPALGNFSLNPGSTWIDAGVQNGVLLPSFDYLGNPRVSGNGVDIGPIEYGSADTQAKSWLYYR